MIFVGVLVGFVITVLSWLMLPGHLPWIWRFPFEQPKTVTWALTREWELARDTTIYINNVCPNLQKVHDVPIYIHLLNDVLIETSK